MVLHGRDSPLRERTRSIAGGVQTPLRDAAALARCVLRAQTGCYPRRWLRGCTGRRRHACVSGRNRLHHRPRVPCPPTAECRAHLPGVPPVAYSEESASALLGEWRVGAVRAWSRLQSDWRRPSGTIRYPVLTEHHVPRPLLDIRSKHTSYRSRAARFGSLKCHSLDENSTTVPT